LLEGDPEYFWFWLSDIIRDEGVWMMAVPVDPEGLAYVVDISRHTPRFHDPTTFTAELGDWERALRGQTADILSEVLATTPLVLLPARRETSLNYLASRDRGYNDPSRLRPAKFMRMEIPPAFGALTSLAFSSSSSSSSSAFLPSSSSSLSLWVRPLL
jgi:hypothetical protein